MDADDTVEELQGISMQTAAAMSRAAEVLVRHQQDHQLRRTAETARVTEDLHRRSEAQAQAAEQFYTRTDADWVRHASPGEVAIAWKGVHQWRELDPGRFTGHAENLNQHIREVHGFDPRAAGKGGELDSAAWRILEENRRGRDPEKSRDGEQRERGEQHREQGLANHERSAAQQADGTAQDTEPGSSTESEAATQADHHRAMATAAEQKADRHGANADADLGLDPERDYDTDQRRHATAQQMERDGVPEQARAAKMTADHLNGQHPRTAAKGSGKTRGRARRRSQQQSRTRDQGMSR